MFEELGRYPKEKVRLYLRYLVNSAWKYKSIEQTHRTPETFQGNINIQKRLSGIREERREELEAKVKAFYTKNRYMPLIVRLRRIRKRYLELKKTGGSKKKLLTLKAKIDKCQAVIRKMEKLDAIREELYQKKPLNLL